MKKKPCVKDCHPSNLLEPVMLMALRQLHSYGYELMNKTAGFWDEGINASTVYRTLCKMESNGDIEGTWKTNAGGAPRRMYSITEAGEATLALWMAGLEQYQLNTEAFLRLYGIRSIRDD